MRYMTIVALLLGPIASPSVATATGVLPLEADVALLGEDALDLAGHSVDSGVDLDGDGYDDLIVGAPYRAEAGPRTGTVYVVLGHADPWAPEISLVDADGSFLGVQDYEQAGGSVAGLLDVNGDGFDDLLIGAPYNEEQGDDAGKAYLVLGKASGWSQDVSLADADASFLAGVLDEDANLGWAVAGAGDVDGDGLGDLLVAAPDRHAGPYSDNGETFLFLGRLSGWAPEMPLTHADASFVGESTDDESGSALAGGGDLDGDGLDDLVISASDASHLVANGGAAYLISGRPSGWAQGTNLATADARFLGTIENEYAGWSLSMAGDVDGDGVDDLLVGAYYADQQCSACGRAYLVLGRAGGWNQDVHLSMADSWFVGEVEGDRAGYAVAITGDHDGDGAVDLWIGASRNDELAHSAGQAYFLRGSPQLWGTDVPLGVADGYLRGDMEYSEVGESATSGDLNGDGLADLVVGADGDTWIGADAGQVLVVFGRQDEDADGDGWWVWDGDCDDQDPAIHPGAIEVLDGIDDDCDGIVDDNTEGFDDDGDGYTELDGDCDDADPQVNPGAPELCNGIDDDCDGGPEAYEADVDGDGEMACTDCDDADPAVYTGATETCDDGIDSDCAGDLAETEVDDDGDGVSECGGDCDDGDTEVHAGAEEICNGFDDDCDPVTDEDVDTDGDGWTICDGDCGEGDGGVHPDAAELCDDGIDQDCSGLADDLDADGDGYGGCEDDCADSDPDIHPGAEDIPHDGIDQDCVGGDLLDGDGDGYDGGPEGEDCDDEDPEVHPGADEVPYDGVDDDCDGADANDLDGDGYAGGAGGDDCNDASAAVHPGAEEDCEDGFDTDCDGIVDSDDPDCESSHQDPGTCACRASMEPGSDGVLTPPSLAAAAAFLLVVRRRGRRPAP